MLPRRLSQGFEKVLTIGHSTLAIEVFREILRQNECRILVDVRTVPRSRHNPQFEQDALAASLRSEGFEYRWMRGLGGLRPSRKDSINFGWRNKSFRGYADYMQTEEFAAAMKELLALDSEPGVAIMCAEAVPWRCHRSLIGDALLARGVQVEDIFGDAKGKSYRKPHELTSFARVDGVRVWYPPEDSLFAEMEAPAQ